MGVLSWLLGRKPITFEGGNGDSMATAVVVRGARGGIRGVPAEYEYLAGRFGRQGVDWQLAQQSLLHAEDGKHYDHFRLTLKDGRAVEFYLDISEFYGRL